MGIFDRFKKTKKEPEKKSEKELKEIKVEKELKKVKVEKEKKPKPRPVKQFSEAWRILKSPHITEKATDLTKQNKYIFKVMAKANKIEIKKAIEDLYKVKVTSVNIINTPGKKRRLGRTQGFKPGYRKAIVSLKEGEKIEIT